jgi:uncharacterized protein
VFRWRFGIGWWLVVLFGLPVIALLLGVAVVVINLWEETVWAGFSKPVWRPASTSSWPPF